MGLGEWSDLGIPSYLPSGRSWWQEEDGPPRVVAGGSGSGASAVHREINMAATGL